MSEVTLGVVDVDPEGLGDCGVHSPATGLDVFGRDERIGGRVVAVLVDEPDRVEHLHRMVGVEARKDLCDCAEVAVDELAQTTVVVDRARAEAPCDEEFEVRDAECVLDVDGEEAEAKGVLCRWAYTVLLGPRLRLARGPRMELAELRLRGSARSAWGAAAHALRYPVVRRSQLCARRDPGATSEGTRYGPRSSRW